MWDVFPAQVAVRTWESACSAPPPARAAALVAACGHAGSPQEAMGHAACDVAEAAAAWYRDHVGGAVEGVLACDACGTSMEVAVPVSLFLGRRPPALRRTIEWVGGGPVTVRSLSLADLLAAAAAPSPVALLRARSVMPPHDAGELPEHVRAEVDAAAEVLAGAADTIVESPCPQCAHPVAGSIDITEFLWQHVAEQAERLLNQVAALAAAFGWSEEAILALEPARRAAYLRIVAGDG